MSDNEQLSPKKHVHLFPQTHTATKKSLAKNPHRLHVVKLLGLQVALDHCCHIAVDLAFNLSIFQPSLWASAREVPSKGKASCGTRVPRLRISWTGNDTE